MEEKLPFLDKAGVIRLWQHIIAKIGVKADKSELSNYCTKTEIDNLELITIEDIDTICGANIVNGSEVTY